MFGRCINIVRVVFSIVVLPIFFVTLFPNNISAQGQLYCREMVSGDPATCIVDLTKSPNPNCLPNHIVPNCDSNCCESQRPTKCEDVGCILDPSAPGYCGVDENCTGQDSTACTDAGGESRACTIRSNGATGACCVPETPPPSDDGCESDEQCWDWGEAACLVDGGRPLDKNGKGCTAGDGGTAYCCVPRATKCESGYFCDTVGGGNTELTCTNNQGVPKRCLRFDGKDTGNCCLPGSDVYSCILSGSKCVPDLSSVASRCGNNYGHCREGDDGCISCDEIGTDNCMGTNLQCVEQNETAGYYCHTSVFGCYPCFDFNADPESPYYIPACDPPSYRSSTPDGNYSNCHLACSGQVPVTYRCQDKYGCIQDDSGEFDGMQQCGIECGGPELFCDFDGKPVVLPDDKWIRLNTAIGCIPLAAKDSDEVNVNYVIEFFLEFGTGMAGGVALFLIIVGSIQIMTSAGDPQRVQAGKELVAAAISGVLLLVFGVYLLRIIGVDILGIPGL